MAPPSRTLDLGELFERHGRALLRLARRLVGEDAEDLVQEAFLRAAERSGMPADPERCEAWLVRVLVNLARDRYRRARVRRQAKVLLARPDRAPDDPAAEALARRDVTAALACLPPRRRAVVVLHELQELDSGEIARLLGIRAVTVRWHLAAGRSELARLLGLDESNRRHR